MPTWYLLSIRVAILLFALALVAGAVAAAPQESTNETEAAILRALAAIEEDRLEDAIKELEPTGRRPDAEIRVLAILGALYFETGRAADALRLLQPLADRQDAEPAVLYNAGRAALSLGQHDQGERYLERSLEATPETPAARELGLLHGVRGDFAEAYALLLPWVRAHPGDEKARSAAALCAVQLERVPEAEELLSSLPQDQPRVRLLRGRVLLLKGDPREALAILEPLTEKTPPEIAGDLRRLLALAHTTVGQADRAVALLEGHVNGSPSLALQLAQARYQSGDLAGALATLRSFAERLLADPAGAAIPPETAQVIARDYGGWLLIYGDYAAALPHLENATHLGVDDKQAWQALGKALAGLGRREEAKTVLERFEELAAADLQPSALERRASLELADPTRRQIRKALELLSAGRGEEALRIARAEKRIVDGDLRPVFAEGRILLVLGRLEEARALAEEIVAAVPHNPDARYLRGTIRMAQDDLAGAEGDFRRALEISPQHTASMNDLAILLIERGEITEARKLLEKALETNPGDELALANLASLDSP